MDTGDIDILSRHPVRRHRLTLDSVVRRTAPTAS
jgi:hypothetical protein